MKTFYRRVTYLLLITFIFSSMHVNASDVNETMTTNVLGVSSNDIEISEFEASKNNEYIIKYKKNSDKVKVKKKIKSKGGKIK